MQVCDQVGATVETDRELHRHPKGGLLQVEEEPAEGFKAHRQAVVLHPHQRIWTSTATTSVHVVGFV